MLLEREKYYLKSMEVVIELANDQGETTLLVNEELEDYFYKLYWELEKTTREIFEYRDYLMEKYNVYWIHDHDRLGRD